MKCCENGEEKNEENMDSEDDEVVDLEENLNTTIRFDHNEEDPDMDIGDAAPMERPGPNGEGNQKQANLMYREEVENASNNTENKTDEPIQTLMHAELPFNQQVNYKELMELEKTTLVPNIEEFTCPMCRSEQGAGAGVMLKGCLHTFCRACLVQTVQLNVEAEVRCPFICDTYSCESLLLQSEIKALVPEEVFENHLSRSLALAELNLDKAFHCRTPDCQGWGIIEQNVNAFMCPVCQHVNCYQCRAIHENVDCVTYQLLISLDPANDIEEQEQADMDLINNLQLMEIEDAPAILNQEQFQCPVCLCDQAMGQGFLLKNCLHAFCRDCLARYVELSDDVILKCPFRGDDYICQSLLQQCEVKAILTPDGFEKYLARSLAQVEHQTTNSYHCKTPDCPGWGIIEDAIAVFHCPVCRHFNCIGCQAIHEGMTCQQHRLMGHITSETDGERNRVMLQEMVQKGEAMVCPTCKVVVQKTSGCDGMSCLLCKTELCWATKGARWGPGGRGDTTGGCRCGFEGRRCHPNCRNCH